MALFAVLPQAVVPCTHSPQPFISPCDIHQCSPPGSENRCTLHTLTSAESPSSHHPVNTTPPPSQVTSWPSALTGTPCGYGPNGRVINNDSNNSDDSYGSQESICKDYDKYIEEDLATYRVYISFENVLQNILHVPSDWKSEGHEYQKIITKICSNNEFTILRNNYLALCDTNETLEHTLYKAQASLYNHAITLINENCDQSYRKKPHLLLHFRMNHPKRTSQGIVAGKSGPIPDLTGVGKVSQHEKLFVWPMVVHVEEMTNMHSALDTGEDSPRAGNEGEDDPLSTYYSLAQKRAQCETEAQSLAPNNKRKMSGTAFAPSKIARTSQQQSRPTTSDAESSVSSADYHALQEKNDKIKRISKVRLHCVRYLMEMLEYSFLRSHAFVTPVDRNQLQLVYADRSVIVTSSIVDLRDDNGLDMFLAMLIAFHRLTPEQWGFLPLVDYSKKYDRKSSLTGVEKHEWLKGLTMRVQQEGTEIPTNLVLGDVIYHQPGIIGRGTCVVRVTCKAPDEEWKGQNLVVKVSWPSADRVSEFELLKLARDTAERLLEKRKQKAKTLKEEARKLLNAGDVDGAKAALSTADNLVEGDQKHWVLKHLPNILHSQNFDLGSDTNPMPQTKLAQFFESAKFFHRKFKYEHRALRANVQEELQKLTGLSLDRQYAQAFYDVFLCHRWLHEYPGVLHQDISAGNIMYRVISGEVYGVLNDFDLSSCRENLEHGDSTSLQRMGTPPYMAVELLSDLSPIRHLYRHDLESLTYVILLHCSRNELKSSGSSKRLDKSLFQEWFDPDLSYKTLRRAKEEFWDDPFTIASDIHPSFRAFVPWIQVLLVSFKQGFRAKEAWEDSINIFEATPQEEEEEEEGEEEEGEGEEEEVSDAVARNLLGVDTEPPLPEVAIPPTNFDAETLGGYIGYGRLGFSLWKFKDRRLNFRDKDGHLQT